MFASDPIITGITWNLENFFDWTAQTDNRSDVEFSATGKRHWKRSRFYRKCDAVAKTVLASADEFGAVPDFVAVQEVENAFVVRQLIGTTPLSKLGYEFVHFDSPDHRGIDCALLYRRSRLKKISAKPCHIFNPDGTVRPTRDILLAVFLTPDADTLAILVNHHPSKVGASGQESRDLAMARLLALRDSLSDAGIKHIVALGDFNDSVEISQTSQPPVAAQRPPAGGTRGVSRSGLGLPQENRATLGTVRGGTVNEVNGGVERSETFSGASPSAERAEFRRRQNCQPSNPRGTIKYNGAWEKIDACMGWGVSIQERIFAFGPLLTEDRAWGGTKPLRTYSGPRYLGGVSDHLPLYVRISK